MDRLSATKITFMKPQKWRNGSFNTQISYSAASKLICVPVATCALLRDEAA